MDPNIEELENESDIYYDMIEHNDSHYNDEIGKEEDRYFDLLDDLMRMQYVGTVLDEIEEMMKYISIDDGNRRTNTYKFSAANRYIGLLERHWLYDQANQYSEDLEEVFPGYF